MSDSTARVTPPGEASGPATAVPRGTGERAWWTAGAVLLAVLALVALATFRQYGLTWDEEVHSDYGDAVIEWYATGFRERLAVDEWQQFLSTGLFDVAAQAAARASPLGPYETRHLVGALVGLLAVAATWRIGALVAGARAGALSAALLALTPVFYGHMFNNPKDVPLAACYAIVLLYVLRAGRELPRVRWSLVLRVGLALGAALAVRVGSAFLLGFVALHWLAPLALRRGAPWPDRRRALGAVVARLAAATAIAYAILLASWPWAQLGPLTRPVEALRWATRFPAQYTILFDGAVVRADALPWRYLPTWFAISLPEFYFVALGCGAAVLALALARRASAPSGRTRELVLLALAAFAPPVAGVVTHAVLYDAQRHFLFVLPPFAALCGVALSSFLAERALPRLVRAGAAVATAASLALTAVDMVRLHPYQTVFFNRLVAGGLASAATRFETDYWGSTYREGLEAVLRHYRPDGHGFIKVANCSKAFLTGYWLERGPAPPFVNVAKTEDPDLLLATSRLSCNRTAGTVLHTVQREGAPLMWVIERRRRGVWVE